MKKMFFGVVMFSTFLTMSSFETPEKETISQTNYQMTKTMALGTCHITIVDTRTSDVVYEIELLANTAEECEKMGEATLDAIVKGKKF